MRSMHYYLQLIHATPGWQKYEASTAVKTAIEWMVLWIFNRTVRMHSAGEKSLKVFGFDLNLEQLLILWFVCRVLSKIVSEQICVPIKNQFDKDILLTFREHAMSEYESLNFPTRKVETLSTYLPRFRNAMSFVRTLSGMGRTAFLGLIRALFDVYIALGDVPLLQYVTTIALLGTFYILSKKANQLNSLQRTRRDKEEKVNNNIKMEEPYFEMGKKDRSALLVLHREFADLSVPVLDMQQEYASVLSFGEEVIVLAVILSHFHLDAVGPNVINILRSIVSMCQSFHSCSKFHKKYVDEESNMTKYLDFWEANEHNKIELAKRMELPAQLTCIDISFSRSEPAYSMRLRNPFVLPLGAKVLLRGGTGSGKSTFCELVQGRDVVRDTDQPAMVFEEGNQRGFAHHMSECMQDVSAMVKWDTSTVRDHFDGEIMDENILKFCRLTYIADKVLELGLDSRINKRLSGGEKQRITLAASLHYNVSAKAKFMMFDEPEKGLGKAAPSVISNILRCSDYTDTTILISSHQADLDLSSFSHIIDIEKNGSDAVVSVTKTTMVST